MASVNFIRSGMKFNKKAVGILLFIFLIIAALTFLLSKAYSLYSIHTVANEYEPNKQFSRLIPREIQTLDDITALSKIELGYFSAKSSINLSPSVSPSSKKFKNYYFSAETKEGTFKGLSIKDKTSEVSLVSKSLQSQDQIKLEELFEKGNLDSDFDLVKLCLNTSPDTLTLLSSSHDFQLAMSAIIFRSIFIIYDGGIFEFELPSGLKGIQFGDPKESHTVAIFLYDNRKALFEINFAQFSQQEIDFFLNTIDVNEPELGE